MIALMMNIYSKYMKLSMAACILNLLVEIV